MPWSEAEIIELKRLVSTDAMFYAEIARALGKDAGTVRHKAKQLGLPPTLAAHRLGSWNAKHVHMSAQAMEYYETHTWQETVAKFSLSLSAWKSLEFYARKRGLTKHKDKRTHDKWTVDELLFLLRHAGIRQRDWIAKQIKRGNSRVIKEKLMSMRVNTKSLNGMTLSLYRQAFGREPSVLIEGDAGPTRGCMPTFFKIVPWVQIYRDLLDGVIKAPPAMIGIVDVMSDFQYWIHGADPIQSMQDAAEGKHQVPKIERHFFVERA